MLAAYAAAGVSATAVGSVLADTAVSIAIGGQQQISGALAKHIHLSNLPRERAALVELHLALNAVTALGLCLRERHHNLPA